MQDSIPIPGTTKAKLIQEGIKMFSEQGYSGVEVDVVASAAGVTVGALYHHFKSKLNFYGILRDDMNKRILDRMEAVAESVPPEHALRSALLAAFDGVIKIKADRLFTEPDPRGSDDVVAGYLSELAAAQAEEISHDIGYVLAAALRAALTRGLEENGDVKRARQALEILLS